MRLISRAYPLRPNWDEKRERTIGELNALVGMVHKGSSNMIFASLLVTGSSRSQTKRALDKRLAGEGEFLCRKAKTIYYHTKVCYLIDFSSRSFDLIRHAVFPELSHSTTWAGNQSDPKSSMFRFTAA